ncbi:hypothetical protein DENSPDRAFT_883348 [Dentipellis sp. KUC8613]|nr:hypothetical protein DENSPDRAFT_883348 [Dentipellis sp. KUC8613]
MNDEGEISGILSKRWAPRSAEEEAHYKAEADRADAEHKLKYPGYKYKRVAKKEKGGKVKGGLEPDCVWLAKSVAVAADVGRWRPPNAPQQDDTAICPSRVSLTLVNVPPPPVLQDFHPTCTCNLGC